MASPSDKSWEELDNEYSSYLSGKPQVDNIPQEDTGPSWDELDRQYAPTGAPEPSYVPPAPPPTPMEEPGLLDQLIGGYYDFRSRSAFETAVSEAKGPPELKQKDLAPGSMGARRYVPGEKGALVKELTPEERRQRVQEALDKSAAFAEKGKEIPLSQETMDFLDENSGKTIWEAFKDAPVKIITELGARSGAAMAPGMLLGTAAGAAGGGPLGFAAGMGIGSARVDYAATVMGELQQAGVDLTDADAVAEFVNSPAMKKIERDAVKRAAVVGGVDAISGLIGAKNLTAGMSSKIASEVTNAALQMPLQAGLGAAGEAGGELARGRVPDPREVAAEAAGEFVTAPVEIAGAGISGAREAAAAKREGGPLEDLTADDLRRKVNDTRAARGQQIEAAQQLARQEAAAQGLDALEQEMAAAQAGLKYSSVYEADVKRLNRLWEQRLAADEEARYADEQVKEDAKRAEIQAAAAKRYEEGLAKIDQEQRAAQDKAAMAESVVSRAAEVKSAAIAEERGRAEKAKVVSQKQRRAEHAESQLRKLRKIRQEKGLEPKSELGGISPYPSEAEVAAHKGGPVRSTAMAEAFTRAANEAATSPTNNLPEPSQAQIDSGNYKKGHAKIQGVEVTIENPRGSTRKGKGWKRKLKDHYGYIKRSSSAEGQKEQLDVFVGDNHDSENVFVVNQVNPKTGEFDEHKVMMGYVNQMAAVAAYKRNYPQGHPVGPITKMTIPEFKQWVKEGDMTQPLQKIAGPKSKKLERIERFKEVIQAKARKEGRGSRILTRLSDKTYQEANKPDTVENKAAEDISRKYFDDKEIDSAKKQNYKSREKLVYMSPDQFLKMAERLRFADEQKASDVKSVVEGMGEKWNSLPLLTFENQGDTAQVLGHEGRHRAMYLKKQGVEVMPVRLISAEGGPAPAIRWQEYLDEGGALPRTLKGQSGGEIEFPVPGPRAEQGAPQPRTDQELAEAVITEGGFTADPKTGAAITEGYAVGVGAESRMRGYPTGTSIGGYKRINAALLEKPDHALGGWFYEGETFLDVSKIFPETPQGLQDAMELARKNREIGIMQLSKAKTGDGYIEMQYSEEELATPVEGDVLQVVHYSNEARDVLEGSRYGTGIKGQEAERLSDPGFADIRDRVYVYVGKHNKESGLGPVAHKWEQPRMYNAGKDPMDYRKLAREMAEVSGNGGDRGYIANMFDRIVKEAGYAGLYVEEMNNTGYVFGDVAEGFDVEVANRQLYRRPDQYDDEWALTHDRAEAIVRNINERLPLMQAELVRRPSDLPKELYDQLAEANAFEAKGLYDIESGKIYIISENNDSAQDLVETIMHEGVAHKGLRYLFGDDLPALLEDVYNTVDRRKLTQLNRTYGLDTSQRADRLTLAEEYIASIAEGDIDAPILQRVIDAVRRVLRDLGLVHLWTDNDIKDLLRRTRSGLRVGKPLSKIMIPSELEISDTGEVVEIEERADIAIRQMDKRINMLDQLRGCVG